MLKFLSFFIMIPVLSAYANDPKQGISSHYNQAKNETAYNLCEQQKCVRAVCKGERLTEACKFEGEQSLKPKLIQQTQFLDKMVERTGSIWEKNCGPGVKRNDPKVICYEGPTKKEKPANTITSTEQHEDLIVNGNKRTVYHQVFILK